MIYTYIFALIIFLLALYIAKHLYLKDNTKVYQLHIYHIILFILILMLPYINICIAIVTVLNVITKNSTHIDYYYTGIFSKTVNKLIVKYNNFLWLEI